MTTITRVEYRDSEFLNEDLPGTITGWYICDYATVFDMDASSPYEVVGPYMTKAEAMRMLKSMPLSDEFTLEGKEDA